MSYNHTALNLCKVRWLYDDKEEDSYCIINGATFAEAAANLAKDYGEENIISMEIFPMETGSTTISRSIYMALKKEWYYDDLVVMNKKTGEWY